MVVEHFHQLGPARANNETESLTGREREILRAYRRGIGIKKLPMNFGYRHDTVRSHLRSIYDKLRVGSRTARCGQIPQQIVHSD